MKTYCGAGFLALFFGTILHSFLYHSNCVSLCLAFFRANNQATIRN